MACSANQIKRLARDLNALRRLQTSCHLNPRTSIGRRRPYYQSDFSAMKGKIG